MNRKTLPPALALGLFFALTAFFHENHAGKTPAGWASQTGFRNASTQVQIKVVSNASYSGSTSASVMAPSGAPWLTDCAGGDGARMRSAINLYAAWFNANVFAAKRCAPPAPPSTVITNMTNALNGPSGCSTSCSCSTCCYNSTSKSLMVNRIKSVYNQKCCQSPNSTVATPTSDQQTLDFLGIRKQCLEWAETIAKKSGGKYRGYGAAGVSTPANYRPGMGLYKTDKSHAMILIDIYWDANGNPTQYKVAEANYGTGWQNPCGFVPWERVTGLRTLTSIAGCKVINYE